MLQDIITPTLREASPCVLETERLLLRTPTLGPRPKKEKPVAASPVEAEDEAPKSASKKASAKAAAAKKAAVKPRAKPGAKKAPAKKPAAKGKASKK